jgi:nucleotide-binding universal stress UspA family protein
MATVLMAWDGSEAAATALRVAARELSERTMLVLLVSQSSVDWAFAPVLGPMLRMPDVDEAILANADETLDRGVQLATELGYEATGRIVTTGRPAWHVILDVASEVDPSVIVAGSHGHSPVMAGLLGSSASGLVQRSRVPVLIVPAPPS